MGREWVLNLFLVSSIISLNYVSALQTKHLAILELKRLGLKGVSFPLVAFLILGQSLLLEFLFRPLWQRQKGYVGILLVLNSILLSLYFVCYSY